MRIAKMLFLSAAVFLFAVGCGDPVTPVFPSDPNNPNNPSDPGNNPGNNTPPVSNPGHVIKPTNFNQSHITSAFNTYKSTWLRTQGSMSYVYAQGTFISANAQTISEAHGYAMIIFALMNDRAEFDRLNNFRKAHPSTIDNRLMAWFVNTVGQVPADGTSATDGDLDNAYALLLAHQRWGGNYRNEAIQIINGLKESCMHPAPHYRTKLGDWHARDWGANRPGNDPRLESRTSDWRPAHFRAFYRATGDNFWNLAADMVHTMLASASNAQTGLMPDFVSRSPAQAEANPSVSGEHNMHNYSFNACRVPWFLAMDWAHYGTPAARDRMNSISNFLRQLSGGTPANINSGSGFTLNGNRINPGEQWTSVSFMAPFASGMIADGANQQFLNATYTWLQSAQGWGIVNKPYEAAIRLLNMLLISGNWDAP